MALSNPPIQGRGLEARRARRKIAAKRWVMSESKNTELDARRGGPEEENEFPFQKLTHLVEQIGKECFAVLLNPDNAGKVREFAESLLGPVPLAEMTIGGRTYEIYSADDPAYARYFWQQEEDFFVDRGQEAGEFILAHQEEIPSTLRDKTFLFPDWRCDDRQFVTCVGWSSSGDRWVPDYLPIVIMDEGCFLRRKT